MRNRDKISTLTSKYPDLFTEDGKPTLISPIECDDGWFDLINGLCAGIQNHCEHEKITCRVDQIKEKFGGLRFYCTGDMYIHGMVMMAEEYSFFVCESCGNKASCQDDKGWMVTLCDSCMKQRLEDFKKRQEERFG